MSRAAIPTAAEFRAAYDYCPTTGALTRKAPASRGAPRLGPVGCPAGKHGHLQFRHNGRTYYVARVAFLMMTGRWPEPLIDHRDGNVLNNAWANLNEVSHKENSENRSHITPGRLSEFIGVSLHKQTGKYAAYIRVGGVKKHLGYHHAEQDAFAAYLAAKADHHQYQPVPRGLQNGGADNV
jgi:hypothetical protein